MDMATVLRRAANLLMGLTMVRLVARDLGAELRHDAAVVGGKTSDLVRRSPYRAAGSAAALGLLAGIWLSQHRNRALRS